MVLGDHNLENLKQLAAACDQDLEDAAIAQYKAKSRSARVAVASLRRLRRPEARDWTSLLMEHYAWHIKDPYLVTIAGLEYLVRHPSAIGVEEGKPRRTTQRTTQGSPRGGGGRPNECQARHSEDFSSVYWYGEHYSFSRLQARCVKVLWEAWTNGTPELHQATILDEAGSLRDQQRLAVIFRPHSAWRRMIVPGSRKGTFKLQTLSGPPDPSEKQNIGKTST
jgi:hypothetical protein